MEQAKKEWDGAHQLWVDKARTRISDELSKWWLHNGSEINVKFESKGGIEYFVAGDAETIILCFRGTEVGKFSDILTDLVLWQIEEPGEKKDGKRLARLHEGFWNAIYGVWDDLTEELNGRMPKNGQQPDKKQTVWITGHSLGGALATLAAYRLVKRPDQKDGIFTPDQIGGVFTFGQPRVGNRIFVEKYRGLGDRLLDDRHFRFVNNNDVVTTVPPKSFWFVTPIIGWGLSLLPRQNQPPTTSPAAESKATGPNADGKAVKRRTIEYGDVGRVVLANRADGFKVLTPDWSVRTWKFWQPVFWWPVRHWLGFFGSWLQAPFMPFGYGGFKERFLPGVGDHSMQEYNRLLEVQCEHHAFVVDTLLAIGVALENDPKKYRTSLKAAEKAWASLKSKAEKAAWAARKRERKRKEDDQNAPLADRVRKEGAKTWNDVVKRERQSAINEVVSVQKSHP